MSSGPKSMFKKRSSLGSSPMASLRSSSWSVPEMFKASSIDDFVVEELGGRSGNLVYGPVSVFNGESLWLCSHSAGWRSGSRF